MQTRMPEIEEAALVPSWIASTSPVVVELLVGALVGATVAALVGVLVGATEGDSVAPIGASDSDDSTVDSDEADGRFVGVGLDVGGRVAALVGPRVGVLVGA